MHKKGLSDMVTTILIILVALAAVVIIWNFLRPFLANTGIDTQAFTSSLSSPDAQASFDGSNVSIRISRNAGDGEIVGFLVGLEGPSGNVKTFRQNMSINQLETGLVNINYTDQFTEDILEVTVTPIFRSNNTGKEIVGLPITTKPTKYKLPSGLIAHWKFDGDYLDSSSSNLHGALSGSSATFVAGKKGQAISFTGNPFTAVTVAGSAGVNYPEMTFVAWINPAASQSVGAYLMYKQGSGTGWNLFYSSSSQSTFRINANAVTSVGFAPAPSQWTQIVGVYSGGTVRIYSNGQLQQSASSGTPIQASSSTIELGRTYNGIIDEPMIFNRALSNSEIKALYDAYK